MGVCTLNAVAAAIGYAGLVESGRGVRGSLGLSFLAHQSPQFQHEFPSLSGQSSASVSTQSQGQQQTSTAANANSAQHQLMLQQQSYSHNHSGGLLCLPPLSCARCLFISSRNFYNLYFSLVSLLYNSVFPFIFYLFIFYFLFFFTFL